MRGIRLLIVPLFLAALLAPALSSALGLEALLYRAIGQPISLDENRALAAPPALTARAAVSGRFPRAFESFWNDHFGWRHTMLRSEKAVRREVLGSAGRSDALIGNDGWLFFKGDRVVEYTQHSYPYSEEEVAAAAAAIGALSARVQAAGSHYLFVLVPNKHTVYPEHLPAYIRPAPRTRADQLLERLREAKPNVDVLDLRPVLLARKSDGQLYERTGTHWNERGAFAGYEALMRHIGQTLPGVAPLEQDAFTITPIEEGPYPLARMLEAGMGPEPGVAFEPGPALTARRAQYQQVYLGGPPLDGLSKERRIRLPFALVDTAAVADADAVRYSAMIFRDSFFSRLVPYVHIHFGTSAYYWQAGLEWDAIQAERPDLVVHETVERFLMQEDLAQRLTSAEREPADRTKRQAAAE